ncbi:MAG: hypothetical protein RIK87_18195 [Fuerstiella sp.]
MSGIKCRRLCAAMVVLGILIAPRAAGQERSYRLQLEILIQPLPAYQLHAQTWGRVLYGIDRRATFRAGRAGEKPRIENDDAGGRRTVMVVGLMNRDGSLSFGGQTFVSTRPEPLAAWLKQLELYGAEGPPNESATWGLNDDQFTEVLKLLGQPVTEPVRRRSAVDVIDSFELPPKFRVTFTEAARGRLFRNGEREDSQDYKGLTKGSMLAAALADFGLGFRPKVNDSGGYLIEVDAGNESDNMYPVGWKNTSPITLVVPELAKSIPVDLEDAPLDALIDVIADKLKLPRFYSGFALDVAGKDPTKIKYSRKPDKLTLYNLIDIIGKTYNIGISLRTDEIGNVFLWVTTEEDYKAFRKRFAHVRPAP